MKPDEIADLLDMSGHAFAGLLHALPPEAAAWRPADGEWCVNECVGHVIESEKRGFAGRIRIMLGAENPGLEAWDQDGVGPCAARLRPQTGRAAGRVRASAAAIRI